MVGCGGWEGLWAALCAPGTAFRAGVAGRGKPAPTGIGANQGYFA